MMRNLLLSALLLGVACATAPAQILTTFGSDAESFGSWTYQPASSLLEGSASPGDMLYGSALSQDITGATGLTLTASAATPPSGSFQIILEDDGGNYAWADFYWADFLGSASVTSAFSSIDTLFNFASVTGWSLSNGGFGDNISTTVASLSAVPEPATILLATLGLGFALIWRHRSSARR